MNNMRIVFFLVVLLVGCSDQPTVEFQNKVLTEKDQRICQSTPCPILSISYPVAAGLFANEINKEVEHSIVETFDTRDETTQLPTSIFDAAQSFVRLYQEHKAEYFDMTAEYEATLQIYQTYQSKRLICFQKEYYTFTGGAHGYGGSTFIYFDLEAGTGLSFEDLIRDTPEFTQVVENYFRDQFELPSNTSINSTGFFFDNETFKLPDAIGLDDQEVVFIYNPYEIAPYADGQIELRVPLNKLKNYLLL